MWGMLCPVNSGVYLTFFCEVKNVYCKHNPKKCSRETGLRLHFQVFQWATRFFWHWRRSAAKSPVTLRRSSPCDVFSNCHQNKISVYINARIISGFFCKRLRSEYLHHGIGVLRRFSVLRYSGTILENKRSKRHLNGFAGCVLIAWEFSAGNSL